MKKVLKAAIIALIILSLALFAKNQFTPNLMKIASYGMVRLEKEGETERLFIGSSVFKQGLDVNKLRETWKEDWYILAYNGNQPIMMKSELKKLVDEGVSINHIYVDMYSQIITQMPKLSDEKILLELDIPEKIEIYETLYGKNVSKELWDMFVTANNSSLVTWPITAPMVNARFDRGGTLVDSASPGEEVLRNAYNMDLSLEMNDTQRRAIIDIVEIAKSNGIDITFLEIPQYVPVNEANIYDEIRQEYCDLLKDLEVEYILADVIGFDCSDAGCYQDLIHLSSTGRTKYTTLLTDYLNYGIE